MPSLTPVLPLSTGAQITLSNTNQPKKTTYRKSIWRVPKGLCREREVATAPRGWRSSRRGWGQLPRPEPAPCRTTDARLGAQTPRKARLGFLLAGRGTPALPGPGGWLHCSRPWEVRESACQREFISGKRRGTAKLEKVDCEHLRGRGMRKISGIIPLSFPKPYKIAHGDPGDLPNPRRT